MSDLIELRDAMRQFTSERDWEVFHDPKSLLLALVGEVGELAELLQWLPAEEAQNILKEEPKRSQVSEEIADVLLYLVRLADVLSVDLFQEAIAKMAKNRTKHPASIGDLKRPS
jgi:NTP pyrophosphatase (non-canonical NTP hydrolase)